MNYHVVYRVYRQYRVYTLDIVAVLNGCHCAQPELD